MKYAIGYEMLADAQKYLEADEELKDEKIPELVADFVIEKFIQHRNYPDHFTKEAIEKDIHRHMSTVTMAIVDVFAHYGAEGETSHSEKNISRAYESAYISGSLFEDILPFIKVF